MKKTFYISSLFYQAWTIYKQNWMKVLGVALGLVVLNIGLTWLGDVAFKDNESMMLIVQLVVMVINTILGIGTIKYILQVVRGEQTDLSVIWKSSSLVVKYFLGNLLLGAMVLGGLILLILPGIYLAMKYMYIPYLIADRGEGPLSAMKLSGKMTAGIKLDLLAVMLVSALVGYAGILLLGVGLLITVPVASIASFLVYDMALKRVENA